MNWRTRNRSACFMAWLTMLIIVAASAAVVATRPLPGNLDALVVSDGALERLHREATGK